tara:strand:- start:174 stop:1082 length:909 start_codon:yes stop_codon:yes gene_type:complete
MAIKKYTRKPVPKKQKTISEGLQKAFDTERGNPNRGNNPPPSRIGSGLDFNRGYQQSMKDDTAKPFSIGIQDLDEAVFYYFNNVIKPFVFQNGDRRSVPIIYANPERWKSYQRDGYYRDKGGSIMLPLLVIKRDTLTKDRSVYNKLDANNPNLYGSFKKQYNYKNAYGQFAVLNNRTPVKTYNLTVVPDFVTLNYSCLIQTYYMEQMNKIIEACEYASDAYWGDPERFKFRAFIDSFATSVETTVGSDRFVAGNFDIRLRGYIIPDVYQKDLTAIKKVNSKTTITVTSETVSDINNIPGLRE